MKKIRKSILSLSMIALTFLLFVSSAKAKITENFANVPRTSNSGTKTAVKDSSDVIKGKVPKEYSYFGLGVDKTLTTSINGRVSELKKQVGGSEKTVNVTDVLGEYTAAESIKNQRGYASFATDAVKDGKFYNLYKNAGTYMGKKIDVKISVIDFAPETIDNKVKKYGANDPLGDQGTTIEPIIYLYPNNLGVAVFNIKSIEIKVDFLDENGKSINVKGYASYWDVDLHQGILVKDNNKGLYAVNDNELFITKIGSSNYIYDDKYAENGTAINQEEKQAIYGFTEIFEGSSITRVFTFERYPSQDVADRSSGAISFSSKATVPIELPEPEKKVSKETVGLEEKYTYTITQKIPGTEERYLETFKVVDTLEPVLNADASKIIVLDEDGNNVTDKFTSKAEGQTITIELKDPSDSSFYGKTYDFKIETYIKKGADLSKYKQGNKYVIPNKASVIYRLNGDTKDITNDTKIVNVIYSPEVEKIAVPDTGANISKIGIALGFILILGAVGVITYTSRKNKKALK